MSVSTLQEQMKHLSQSFKVLLVTVVAVMCLATVSTTYMWFTAKDSIENAMALGRQSVTVTEEFAPNGPLHPGDEVIKKVAFINNADYGALVRVRYNEYWIAKDGSALSNSFYDKDTDTWPDVMTKNWTSTGSFSDTTVWTDGGDGYYYYNKVLEPGVATDPVLSSVVFNEKLLNTNQLVVYAGADYRLDFAVDSVVYTASDAAIQAQFGSNVRASVASNGSVVWNFA